MLGVIDALRTSTDDRCAAIDSTKTPTLSDDFVQLLLRGRGLLGGSMMNAVLFSDPRRAADLLRRHEAFLLVEAARLGIPRPRCTLPSGEHLAYYREHCVALIRESPERYGRSTDGVDPIG